MGLASAMTTSLTGLTAAETTIDVVGNNLANANTVGFKSSEANFATQFLQVRSLGSAPTGTNGGTNPRQVGLGTMVADITPDFSQGTIEISSNPTDLAIQGDGFFIVQGSAGEQLYTRNGIFKLNAENELVNMSGNRVLGFGIDDQFQIQTTSLVPLNIPLGNESVAQSTSNVFLEGTLSPTGDLANTGEIIQTAKLSSDQYGVPVDGATASSATQDQGARPMNDGVTTTLGAAGPLTADGHYMYKFVYYNSTASTDGDEGTPAVTAETFDIDLALAEDSIQFNNLNLLTPPSAEYDNVRIYRTDEINGGGDPTVFRRVGQVALGGPAVFADATADAAWGAGAVLDQDVLNGAYTYYITMANAGGGPGFGTESRPTMITQGISAVGARIRLENLPIWDGAGSGGWTHRRIYRNLSTDSSAFYFVGEVDSATTQGLTFTDRASDADISGNTQIDFDGPPIIPGTPLANVLLRDGTSYENPFQVGELRFAPRKGGRTLETKVFDVTATSTVLDLVMFMEEAAGIRGIGDDPLNPIPDGNPDPTVTLPPGSSVTPDGRIQIVSNNGVDNRIEISQAGMQAVLANGTSETVSMAFRSTQDAVGESAVADFLAYDTLGIPLAVRLTTVLESRDDTSTVYRWFADCSDSSPATGAEIGVGTGLITFDGEGNYISSTNSTVSVQRRGVSSASPLEFELNFSQLSGLQTDRSSLAVSRQDGSGAGTLTSFIMGEDGVIRGVFSNGITRDLGQVRLARFANANGLEQKGKNLFSYGVNSGLPVIGSPGEQGIGTLVAGAVELSNTDIGKNLIEMILASTMYRGNTRVITTAQQLFDELLALRR